MAKATIPTGVIMPEGAYPAHVLSIEDRSAADGGSHWFRKFAISHGGRVIERTALSSTIFSPKAKARQWAEALMGGDGNREFGLDQLVGRRCMVVPDVVERDGESFNSVAQVLRPLSA